MADDDAHDPKDLAAELERARGMLLQSAKLAELGQQVAGLVHEMNQPLLGIKAFAQMLKKELVGNEAAQRKAAFIEEQAIVLERMAARVRRYSRNSEADRNASVDLKQVLDTTLAILAHRLRKVGATVDADVPADLPAAALGEVHAQQILVNLIGNAADALEGRDERRIQVIGRPDNGGVRLLVADSGAGIPDEVRDKIFEPFFTTKGAERGTGLGLPITLEIVKAYGGSFDVVSGAEAEAVAGPGAATAMNIWLPASA